MALIAFIRETMRALREPPRKTAPPHDDEKVVQLEARLADAPDDPETRFELGVRLMELGDHADALPELEAALESNPDVAVVHGGLGHCHLHLGDAPKALECLDRAIALDPALRAARIDRGLALSTLARPAEAIAELEAALGTDPADVYALNNLALALTQTGDDTRAIETLERAVSLAPTLLEPRFNLGNALQRRGRLSEAKAIYTAVIETMPFDAASHRAMGMVLHAEGRIGEAIGELEKAIALDPADPALHSNYLYCLQARPGIRPAELLAAHREWDGRYAEDLRGDDRLEAQRRDPERRLRIGLASRNLARHPVGWFTLAAVEALDPEQFEIVCYSDRVREDEMTARFRARADDFQFTATLSDEALAERIRGDEIDILVDLAGHGAGTRLLAFARRPAPVQVTWIGYPGGTGLGAMDYLVADAHHVPPGSERFYRERILRLDHGYVCYDPPPDAPAIGSLPAGASGPITFGSFNNLSKINAEFVTTWARVLAAVPESRMLLKYRGIDDPGVRERIAAQFEAAGIEAGRIAFEGWSPHREHLDAYNRVDVALDTFPYSGGLTTCEAAWMGVPTVTLPGTTFAGRHSFSHLATIGLGECVAADEDAYVRLAADIAGDRARLAGWRESLRAQVAASPLCDREGFAAEFAAALRAAWRDRVGEPR